MNWAGRSKCRESTIGVQGIADKDGLFGFLNDTEGPVRRTMPSFSDPNWACLLPKPPGDTHEFPLGMSNIEDRHVPARRTFYEVVRRYLLPEQPSLDKEPPPRKFSFGFPLKLRERPGTEDEIELLR